MEAMQSPSSCRHFVKLLLTLLSCVTAQHTDCRDAGNVTELMERFNSLNAGTFVQYDPRGRPNDLTPSTESRLPPRCPRSLGDASAAVNDKALCPWKYRDVHYPRQFPPTLVQATCLCSRCVQNRGFSCEPVKHTIWVLQQTGECRTGVKLYREEQRDVTVGCTCVNPRTN